jgi:N-acyl-D-amino-acid deacylase
MTLFKNGLVIDGTGSRPVKTDVLVDGDAIVGIADGLTVSSSAETIDIDGKILCPGFMDIHAHSELEALRDPHMSHKLQQGITFDLSGNCGIGVFPRKLSDAPVFADILGHYKGTWNWTDFEGFQAQLKPGINMAFLQSHSMLRMAALEGNPNREATTKEIKIMCSLLNETLNQGCMGLSTGLYYAPCLFANEEEIISLLKVVKKHDALFTVHHRCEGDEILSSIDEVLNYVRKTGVRLEISHLKAIGKANQDKVATILEKIHNFRDEGFDVCFDQYPYEYGSTSLFSLLPPFLLRLEKKELSQTLANLENNVQLKEKVVSEMLHPQGWDSIVQLCGWDNITITSLESSPENNGLTLAQAAKKLSKDPFDALFSLLAKENELALMTDITQSTESLRKIFKDPLMHFGTDALYTGSAAHPRSANAAIHLLETMCKTSKIATYEEAICKMTSKVASRLGIKDRGKIAKGMKADLVVFDPALLHDNSSPSNPFATCTGLEYVMINGQFAVYKNAPTKSRSGVVIKAN